MIKAVIFDCFGVLINGSFEEIYTRVGGDSKKDKEFLIDLLKNANLGLISPQEMRTQVASKIGITEEKWQVEIAKIQQPSEKLINFARKLKKDYKIAILSNANAGVLERKFAPEQLAMFDAVVVSADVNYIKPQAEIFLLTAQRLGVLPNECIFVDDNPGFCTAAGMVGMKPTCYKNFEQFMADIKPLLV